MLILGCLVAVSVYAARKSPKEKTVIPAGKTAIALQDPNQKAVLLKTEMDKVSYAIGVQLGQSFKTQEIEIKIESLMQGLKDSMAGKKLALGQDEMQKVMMGFQQRMMAKQQELQKKQQERQKVEAAKNLAAGKAYLEANGTKKGVKVLPSGLQYKIIKKGTGKTPTANDKVKTHYRGTLIDGTEFDSSYKRNRPAEFPVKGVIKGWTEALQLMKEGGKWELYIPANLAYGERGRPNIPANSTLIFEIELLEVVK
jgi:FKBP-type peptidyl-prolyl cis-trans isomerase FklB